MLRMISQTMLMMSLSTAQLSRSPVLRNEGATGASCADILPPAVQTRLTADYASWKIQDVFSLSPSARRSWEERKYGKPSDCPGIAVGTFEDGSEAFAVLLVPRARPERAYRFLVYSSRQGAPVYESTTIEAFDKGGAQNLFIRSVLLSDFFDNASQKKLGMTGRDGVVIVESGISELCADVFFWTRNGYRREPKDYWP